MFSKSTLFVLLLASVARFAVCGDLRDSFDTALEIESCSPWGVTTTTYGGTPPTVIKYPPEVAQHGGFRGDVDRRRLPVAVALPSIDEHHGIGLREDCLFQFRIKNNGCSFVLVVVVVTDQSSCGWWVLE